MNKFLKFFTLALVFAFVFAACATAKPTPDTDGVVGSYSVKGDNPDGSKYDGTLDITASGDAFKLSWNGGEHVGVGIQQDKILSVAWGNEACYPVSYVVEKNGVLTGKWTDMAITGIGGDIATPTDNMGEGLEGLYNALGTGLDGVDYGCSLQVTKKADNIYEWYWFGCGEYTGVGIQEGNVVSVAYGSDDCKVASYQIGADSSLNAKWTSVGKTDLGAEVATPK